MSALTAPSVGTNGNHHQRTTLNSGPSGTSYNLSMTTHQQQQPTSTSPNSTISTTTPAQFAAPPPPPQLFYWPYPSPPISPPNNFFTALQNGPTAALQGTLLAGPIQSNLHVQQGALGAMGNLASHNPIVQSPNQTLGNLLSSPPIPSPEIAKAVI